MELSERPMVTVWMPVVPTAGMVSATPTEVATGTMAVSAVGWLVTTAGLLGWPVTTPRELV